MAWVDRKWDQQNTVILSYLSPTPMSMHVLLHSQRSFRSILMRSSCSSSIPWLLSACQHCPVCGDSRPTVCKPACVQPKTARVSSQDVALTMTSLHHLLCTMLPQEIQSPCACNPQEKAKTHQRLRKRNALGSREIRLSEAWDSMRHSVLLGSKGRQVALELCQPGARCIKTLRHAPKFPSTSRSVCRKSMWHLYEIRLKPHDGWSFISAKLVCEYTSCLSLEVCPSPHKNNSQLNCQRMFQKDSATDTLPKKTDRTFSFRMFSRLLKPSALQYLGRKH